MRYCEANTNCETDMPKNEPKTRETDASVEDFLNSVENKERRDDGYRVLAAKTEPDALRTDRQGKAEEAFGETCKSFHQRQLPLHKASFGCR